MKARSMVLFAVLAMFAGGAAAQDAVTPAILKEKGAKILTKEEAEALLPPGSSVQHEGGQYLIRQINKAGGELDVSGQTRMGGSSNNPPWSAVGTWSINDRGLYCVDYKTRNGGGSKTCATLWVLGSDYFVTYGRADDASGRAIKVSR